MPGEMSPQGDKTISHPATEGENIRVCKKKSISVTLESSLYIVARIVEVHSEIT